MARKQDRRYMPRTEAEDKPATLKDLLSGETIQRLKAQAEELKAEERRAGEEKRKREEEAREAEKKRLENDFGHLLGKSDPDWRKYK